MKSWYYKVLVVTIFAIAMGFLEAVVVVYLRVIYFPDGFDFPLPMFDPWIFEVELVREITTLVMLIAIGILAGKTKNGRFAWFLFTFGVWDIAYYGGLKMFLDWPSSLLTWDILFLIPIVWIGPVFAPVICALTMIVLGVIVARFEQQEIIVWFGSKSWTLLIIGALMIFVSFVQDYATLLYNENQLGDLVVFNWNRLIETSTKLIPKKFNWWLFALGELLILFAVFRIRKMNSDKLSSG